MGWYFAAGRSCIGVRDARLHIKCYYCDARGCSQNDGDARAAVCLLVAMLAEIDRDFGASPEGVQGESR